MLRSVKRRLAPVFGGCLVAMALWAPAASATHPDLPFGDTDSENWSTVRITDSTGQECYAEVHCGGISEGFQSTFVKYVGPGENWFEKCRIQFGDEQYLDSGGFLEGGPTSWGTLYSSGWGTWCNYNALQHFVGMICAHKPTGALAVYMELTMKYNGQSNVHYVDAWGWLKTDNEGNSEVEIDSQIGMPHLRMETQGDGLDLESKINVEETGDTCMLPGMV